MAFFPTWITLNSFVSVLFCVFFFFAMFWEVFFAASLLVYYFPDQVLKSSAGSESN